jgi:hypothetical protein
MNDKILTKQTVMKMFNINRRTFELWVQREGLPCIRIGSNKRFVRLSELYQWLHQKTLNPVSKIPIEPSTQSDFKWERIFSK